MTEKANESPFKRDQTMANPGNPVTWTKSPSRREYLCCYFVFPHDLKTPPWNAPENRHFWRETRLPTIHFQVRTVSFTEGTSPNLFHQLTLWVPTHGIHGTGIFADIYRSYIWVMVLISNCLLNWYSGREQVTILTEVQKNPGAWRYSSA